jgi:hypothetical protein
MKTLLAACVTLGIVTAVALPQARADVIVGAPGVRLNIGPHDHDWHRGAWEHREWEHRHWEAYRERCYYRGC